MRDRSTHTDVEIRAAMTPVKASATDPGFEGYASTFWAVDSYGEAMAPGCFAESIAGRVSKIPVLWNHDQYQPIGRLLDVHEDNYGLRFNARITPGTRAGDDVMTLLRDSVPLGMSFGFRRIKSHYATPAELAMLDFTYAPQYFLTDEGKAQIVILDAVDLIEVSPVTFPANRFATPDAVRRLGATRDPEQVRKGNEVLRIIEKFERDERTRQNVEYVERVRRDQARRTLDQINAALAHVGR